MNETNNQLNKKKKMKYRKTPILDLSVEERLRIFANIIIDRIIEDQASGRLKLENINK